MAPATKDKLLWDSPVFSKTKGSVEAITGVYAEHMLLQSGIQETAKSQPLVVLDNACGTGILTQHLQQLLQQIPSSQADVLCGDFADAMIESAGERVQREGWSNVKVEKIDAQDTGLPNDHFTYVFTNFGVMLVPRPDDALDECYRILQPGGMCAFTTWQHVGWVQDVREAIASIPGVPEFPASWPDMARGMGMGAGEWDDPEYIRSTMTQHNFSEVTVNTVPNTSVTATTGDIQAVVRACVKILVSKFWSAAQREEFENESLFDHVENWLSNKYSEGAIEWHWVALVTTAIKPTVTHTP